jgi:hypothetical protein
VNLIEAFKELRWQGVVEILLLTGVFYYGYKLLRRTQGAKVLSGFLLVFFVALFASRFLELRVLSFLLQAFVSVLVLAFLILFPAGDPAGTGGDWPGGRLHFPCGAAGFRDRGGDQGGDGAAGAEVWGVDCV